MFYQTLLGLLELYSVDIDIDAVDLDAGLDQQRIGNGFTKLLSKFGKNVAIKDIHMDGNVELAVNEVGFDA